MFCRFCGKPCPDDAATCPACHATLADNAAPPAEQPAATPAELPAATPATAELPAPRRGRRKLKLATGMVLGLAVLATAGYGLLLKFFPPTLPIANILPQDSIAVVSLDTPWWWEFTQDQRQTKDAKDAMREVEKTLGLSVEQDIIPWMGDAGVALLDVNDERPQMLAFVQVRDKGKFLAALPKLLAKAEDKAEIKWENTRYKDVEVRRATVDTGGTPLALAAGQVGGWFMLGIGEGAIEKSIDVWKGDVPALSKDANWAKAMAELPRKSHLLFGGNGKSIYDALKDVMPNEALERIAEDDVCGTFACAMTGDEKTLRLEFASVAGSEKLQQQWKEMAEIMQPVKGKMLAHVPQGAFATFIISNPGKMWNYVVDQTMKSSAVDESTGRAISSANEEARPFLNVLDRCQGEFGLSAAWRNGQGFGVVLLGETENASQADSAARQLKDAITALLPPGADIPEENRIYRLPDLGTSGSEQFKLSPGWTTHENWLEVGSNTEWIGPKVATANIGLPGEAKGANIVFLGNMSWLPVALRETHVDDETMKQIRDMHLDTLQVFAYSKITDDGSMQHCVIQLQNWEWKKAGALFAPVFGKSREKARMTRSSSNLKQLALAALMYAQENDEMLPPLYSAEDIPRVLNVSEQLLTDPTMHLPYQPNASLAGMGLGQIADPTSTVIFYEAEPYSNGSRLAAFVDGHVSMVSAEYWEELAANRYIQ